MAERLTALTGMHMAQGEGVVQCREQKTSTARRRAEDGPIPPPPSLPTNSTPLLSHLHT